MVHLFASFTALRTLFTLNLTELSLVEGDAQRLGAHAGSPLVLCLSSDGLSGATFLDVVFARFDFAPGDDDVAFVVENAGEVVHCSQTFLRERYSASALANMSS